MIKKLSFIDAVRFVFSGAILYLYLYFLFPDEAARFASASGVFFPLVIVVVGSGIYFVYRPLLYDPVIERLQCALNRSSYRRRLMEWYSVDFSSASRLWIQIRDSHLRERYGRLGWQAAGLHMAYQAGLLGLMVSVVGFCKDLKLHSMALAAVGALLLVAAVLSDRRHETVEGDMLVSLQRQDVDEIAKSLGYCVAIEGQGGG